MEESLLITKIMVFLGVLITLTQLNLHNKSKKALILP